MQRSRSSLGKVIGLLFFGREGNCRAGVRSAEAIPIRFPHGLDSGRKISAGRQLQLCYWIERHTCNLLVDGSSPSGPTKIELLVYSFK